MCAYMACSELFVYSLRSSIILVSLPVLAYHIPPTTYHMPHTTCHIPHSPSLYNTQHRCSTFVHASDATSSCHTPHPSCTSHMLYTPHASSRFTFSINIIDTCPYLHNTYTTQQYAAGVFGPAGPAVFSSDRLLQLCQSCFC